MLNFLQTTKSVSAPLQVRLYAQLQDIQIEVPALLLTRSVRLKNLLQKIKIDVEIFSHRFKPIVSYQNLRLGSARSEMRGHSASNRA